MTNKPQIQYVGQFYVHGSEAPALQRQKERKRAKTKLPQMRRERVEKIYVDPVALAGIAVAVFMLAVMAVGAIQLHTDWGRYEQMKTYVSDLKQENVILEHRYRNAYDVEQVRTKAQAMGLIPRDEAETLIVSVTLPEPEPETTWLDDVKWFFGGLLEKPNGHSGLE